MYCTLKKRTNKKSDIPVYDLSLCRSIRKAGKVKRLSVHLFTINSYMLEIDSFIEMNINKEVHRTALLKLFTDECEIGEEVVEQAKQLVRDKIALELEKLKHEEREKDKKREQQYQEWTEALLREQRTGVNKDEMKFFLKEAYRTLSKKYHPDVTGVDNGERFKQVKKCYDFLSEQYIK